MRLQKLQCDRCNSVSTEQDSDQVRAEWTEVRIDDLPPRDLCPHCSIGLTSWFDDHKMRGPRAL